MDMKVICLLALVALISCNSSEIRKEYYANKNLKSVATFKDDILDGKSLYYDKSGNKKSEKFFTKGKLDSVYRFNDDEVYQKEIILNDSLIRLYSFKDKLKDGEGYFLNNSIRVGWWSYYLEGKINRRVEFLKRCDKEYANQIINFNDKGDTLKYSEHCFYTKFKVLDNDTEYKVNYEIKSPFTKTSKSELYLFKRKISCSTPNELDIDSLLRLKSNKGSFVLSKKYNIKNILVFNYHFTDTLTQSKERNIEIQKMYFNLNDYIVKK